MKFTLGWLRDHLDTDASVDAIAERLTALGLEVEGVTNPAAVLAPFTIARVLAAERHPAADKLQVCRVDTGAGEVQVVCGAPNARAGMMAVFAPPGAYVPGTAITLRTAAVRGVESAGMLVSERELELSDAHEGIIELPDDAPLGARYAAWAGLDDPVIEVAVTPNRQDCMGVAGIARDLAAAGVGRLRTAVPPTVAGSFPCPIAIAIEDHQGCPLFLGRVVRGVSNGPSPAWLARRLQAVGQKPISVLVDITNYIGIDRGRPLHVYDLARLSGGLTARRGQAGERIEALNGRSYPVDDAVTVIADDVAALGIGGIMGGMSSAVSATTTDVVIECAWFDPATIGRSGRALGLTSDARTRFERGVDPGFVAAGMELATAMVLDLAGGSASAVAVAGALPDAPRTVAFRPARVAVLAGIAIPDDEAAAILARLGFMVERGERWAVVPPSWRRDIDGEADIVEEVARIAGYERIVSTALMRAEGVARPTATAEQQLERRVRRAAAARGLDEAITWSFVAPAEAAPFGGAAFTLDNPISAELAAMRSSLLPGLLAAARRNLDRGSASVRLFEIGRRYLADGEHATLGFVLAGEREPRDWRRGAATAFEAIDAKALALAILAAAGAAMPQVADAAPDWFHPGRSARLTLGPKLVLASVGELHPRLARDFARPVMLGEVFLDMIPPARAGRTRAIFAPSSLQPVTRDFAFVVPLAVAADALLRAVRSADKAAITGVALFDVFTGPGVQPGMKSMGVAVTLQPGAASFTEAEIEAVSAQVVAAAGKLGGALRGG